VLSASRRTMPAQLFSALWPATEACVSGRMMPQVGCGWKARVESADGRGGQRRRGALVPARRCSARMLPAHPAALTYTLAALQPPTAASGARLVSPRPAALAPLWLSAVLFPHRAAVCAGCRTCWRFWRAG
jgi:hypothetical protein